MSVKTVEKQYVQVVAQYHEMLNDLKEMEKDAAEGLVSPEFIQNLHEHIKPIKQNYEWWTFMMYTLHEPQRSSKREKYAKTMKRKIENLDKNNHPDARIQKGKECLETLNEVK